MAPWPLTAHGRGDARAPAAALHAQHEDELHQPLAGPEAPAAPPVVMHCRISPSPARPGLARLRLLGLRRLGAAVAHAGGHRVPPLRCSRPKAASPRRASSPPLLPPAHGAVFLWMVARETWRTVAIATAGITLALVIAVPVNFDVHRVLSVSALGPHGAVASRAAAEPALGLSCCKHPGAGVALVFVRAWWASGPRPACWPLR